MKIVIFGASGRTGKAISSLAKSRGHDVVLHARSDESASGLDKSCKIAVGPFSDPDILADELHGADAVISALGTTIRKPNTVLSDATRNIIQAMHDEEVARFVCITSLGCGKSFDQVSGRMMRWLIHGIGKEIWIDKERQEEEILASGLNYLVVRPGGLSKKPAAGKWIAVDENEPVPKKQMISRDDVADFCLTECETPSLKHKVVTLLAG